MTTTFSIVFAGFGTTGLLALADPASMGQEWTAMALLAAVVLGVGGKMVLSIDKNTTAVQGLVVELRSRNELDRSRDAAIDRVSEGVAHIVATLRPQHSTSN